MAGIEAKAVPLEDPKADYEKLKLELAGKAKAESDDTQLLSEQVELQTYVTNLTEVFLRPIDRHFWAGSERLYLPNLPSGYYSVPTEVGTLPEGVKWGFVYATGTDSTDRKWVVAFDTAAGKAYAEAGPMGEVDWNVVEVKLGQSGSKSEYVDPALGGKTVAEIDGLTAHATFSN